MASSFCSSATGDLPIHSITVFRSFPEFDGFKSEILRKRAIAEAGLTTEHVDEMWNLQLGCDDKIAEVVRLRYGQGDIFIQEQEYNEIRLNLWREKAELKKFNDRVTRTRLSANHVYGDQFDNSQPSWSDIDVGKLREPPAATSLFLPPPDISSFDAVLLSPPSTPSSIRRFSPIRRLSPFSPSARPKATARGVNSSKSVFNVGKPKIPPSDSFITKFLEGFHSEKDSRVPLAPQTDHNSIAAQQPVAAQPMTNEINAGDDFTSKFLEGFNSVQNRNVTLEQNSFPEHHKPREVQLHDWVVPRSKSSLKSKEYRVRANERKRLKRAKFDAFSSENRADLLRNQFSEQAGECGNLARPTSLDPTPSATPRNGIRPCRTESRGDGLLEPSRNKWTDFSNSYISRQLWETDEQRQAKFRKKDLNKKVRDAQIHTMKESLDQMRANCVAAQAAIDNLEIDDLYDV